MNIFSLQLAGMVNSNRIFALSEIVTPLGTNMSHQKATFKMIFLFQRWDMLVTFVEGAWQKKMKNKLHTKILTNGWTPQKYLIFLSKRSPKGSILAHHGFFEIHMFQVLKRKTSPSLRRTMNHLKSILTRGTPRNTSLGSGKWTPANAEESAQKSPA